jgi:hypothetical protein
MGARLGWTAERTTREVAAYEREVREVLVPVSAIEG